MTSVWMHEMAKVTVHVSGIDDFSETKVHSVGTHAVLVPLDHGSHIDDIPGSSVVDDGQTKVCQLTSWRFVLCQTSLPAVRSLRCRRSLIVRFRNQSIRLIEQVLLRDLIKIRRSDDTPALFQGPVRGNSDRNIENFLHLVDFPILFCSGPQPEGPLIAFV